MSFCWNTEFDFALEVVKQAGEIIKKAFHSEKKVTEKSSPTDLVTETDQEVEKVLINGIRQKYPDHRFIGEESVAGGSGCELTDLPTWVIDPIDGTTNFVHSNPNICTILAFMVDQEVEFGIVYNPILDQLWTGRRGQGAYFNGNKITVSKCSDLSQALLIQEVHTATEERVEMLMTNIKTFFPKIHGIRAYGSAGINLAYLAMGAVDSYFEMGFHIWDYAGPSLIVREAGGVVSDVHGDKIDYLSRNIAAASSQQLLDQMIPHIKTIRLPRD